MSEGQRLVANSPKMTGMNLPRPSEQRSAQRKVAPSPLQLTQISTPTTEAFTHSPKDLGSPHSSKAGSAPSYSPRSPLYGPVLPQDMTKSPRERLDDLLSVERPRNTKETHEPLSSYTSKSSPLTTPKESSSHGLRNVSAPILSTTTSGGPALQSSAGMPSTVARTGMDRPEPRFVPRTSSIDSTMSSVSSTTSYSYGAQDSLSPNASDVSQSILAAGSAEAAIRQLLKEKKQSAAQSAQLWRLVNKQRTLVLGLNKDLDRAIQDKERYRKKLKEQLAQSPPVATAITEMRCESPPRRSPPRTGSESPESPLIIQRHSIREVVPEEARVPEMSDNSSGDLVSPTTSSSSINSSPLALDPEKSSLQGLGLMGAVPATTPMASHNYEHLTETPGALTPVTPTQPLEVHKIVHSSPEDKSSPRPSDIDSPASKGSFTARRSITTPRKAQQSPLIDTTPVAVDFPVTSPSGRKAPPAPLDLRRPARVTAPVEKHGTDENSESEYEDILEVDEIPAFERGRRKTREDDDREREIAIIKEQESRSQSKKDKRSKSATDKISKQTLPPLQAMPKSPAIRSFSPDEPLGEMQRHLSPPTSLAGVLSRPPSSTNSNPTSERSLISPFPLSPGLPVSPRPMDRPINSPPPRMPRDGVNVYLQSPPLSPRIGPPLPLSPRPPRHEIPLPPHTPTSLVSPLPPHFEPEKSSALSPNHSLRSIPESQRNGDIVGNAPASPSLPNMSSDVATGGIYRGLVSDIYPDLLLPPNALPSILVKVTSSRLKPSRHSTIGLKGSEDDQVFTLGISARSDKQQLWRVEKAIVSLLHLDQQLKQASAFIAKVPDRSLFVGHAPAKIDARRLALERYFEAILDTPLNEKAALVVCHYLSTHVVQAEEHDGFGASGHPEANSPVNIGPDGRLIKEGFLTKRGKNFGGWKARYFVLDEPTLRYYESPGGPLLGTIKLPNAQIGRQQVQHPTHSPSRGGEASKEEYRHAFLILEPKKYNSNSVVRHVLCAESDEERDQWVEALLQYIGGHPAETEKSRPPITKNDSGSSKASLMQSKKRVGGKDDTATDAVGSEATDAIQSVSYEETVPASVPVRTVPTRNPTDPTSPGMTTSSHPTGNSAHSLKIISGPTNGAVIQDAGAWGNKAPESPKAREKEKKRSIWGFREKVSSDGITNHSNDSNTDLARSQNERPVNVKAVFGIPLAEAVEFCMASGTDVCLPAVVYRCLEYLEAKEASGEEGIFRLSGSNVVIKALRERFNLEGDLDLLATGQYYDVHAVASLLKLYLRELPTTVLTRELHLDFLQVLGNVS